MEHITTFVVGFSVLFGAFFYILALPLIWGCARDEDLTDCIFLWTISQLTLGLVGLVSYGLGLILLGVG